MEASVLLLELGAVILGLAVLARLAARFGFSPIPLYLIAGLSFGEGGLVPLVTAEGFIEVGADIGLILLLLLLGLDYSAAELTRGLRSSGGAGLLDAGLNFVPGFAAGLLLGWGPVAALFLGGITYVSSTGIVAKLLEEFEWLGNRETPTVLSIIVMEDLAMAVYLSVLVVLVLGAGPLGAAASVLTALAAVSLVLVVALRFETLLSRLVFSHSDEVLLLTILGLTLVVAGAAERLQVSAAVAAFLVGITVSGPAADRSRALLTPLRDLFAAVFFVFFGLQIDPSDLPPVAAAAVLLAVIGVLSKVATGWWAASAAGVAIRGRLRAGAILIARGEFSIAIAGLGIAAGVEPELAPLTAAYILLLAVAGPLLSRGADALGVRLVRREEPPGTTLR